MATRSPHKTKKAAKDTLKHSGPVGGVSQLSKALGKINPDAVKSIEKTMRSVANRLTKTRLKAKAASDPKTGVRLLGPKKSK